MIYKYPLENSLTSHCCQNGKPVPHTNQLLNHIVDCHAARTPEALWAEYPRSPTSYDQGYMKITYRKFANAINRIAWYLVANLGHGRDHETLAYIGPNDLVYPALVLGAVKAGYKTLLLSPRNSIEAQLALLKATNCKTFLRPQICPPPLTKLLGHLDSSVNVLTTPSVSDLLQPRCKPFIYDVTYEEGKNTPLLVLHSSGTTGLPKPITWPQSLVTAWVKQLELTPPPGFESTDHCYMANRVFIVYPPFHAAFIANALFNTTAFRTTAILPLSGAIPSAQSLAQTLKHTKVDTAQVVPVIVEELSRNPELLDAVAASIDYIVYTGGDVPQAIGDIVAARVPLINFYGSSEGCSLTLIHPVGELSQKEWKYLTHHPDTGVDFRHHVDDLYELVVVRHPELEVHQQLFHTFPKLDEFRTNDLFKRHPTKPYLWKHCGRADDTIVLLTGEKVTPVDAEQHIFSQNPDINGVLLSGAQRFQVALMIELAPTDELLNMTRMDLIEKFWPSVVQANECLPGHGQITKSHIIFVDPSRPMSRSPKGTIQRAATIKRYGDELDLLYDQAEELSIAESKVEKCNLRDTNATITCLRAITQSTTGLEIGEDDNLFVQGIDSLQAVIICRETRRQVSVTGKIDTSVLYAHPTIRSLTTALQQIEASGSVPDASNTGPTTKEISDMVKLYTALIDQLPNFQPAPMKTDGGCTYLLTGSTGSAGSHLLQSLLKKDTAHVYCVNRSNDSGRVQQERNASRGLSTDFPESRVTFLTADLSLPRFGLGKETYSQLQKSVTHIIHNAWSVNFNVPLSYYDSQVKGVFNLAQFCSEGTRQPQLMYISSISAASNFSEAAVPESIIDDASTAAPTGYGASKYVSERVIGYAAQKLHIDARIARTGQVAGPNTLPGNWNKSEWFPSLIRSSAHIDAVPSSLGPELDEIDWIAVDELAEVVIELTRNATESKDEPEARVYNLINPQSASWKDLLPSIKKALAGRTKTETGTTTDIDSIPFEKWIDRVQAAFDKAQEEQSHESSKEQSEEAIRKALESNPAVKLLDFYKSVHTKQVQHWKTDKAQKASATFKGLGKVQAESIEKWMKSWF